MTRWTIAQLRDKEKYDAWKDDDELIEVDEVDADKAKDKARIKELEEALRKLRNECKRLPKVARECIGNTGANLLEWRIKEATEALGSEKKERKENE